MQIKKYKFFLNFLLMKFLKKLLSFSFSISLQLLAHFFDETSRDHATRIFFVYAQFSANLQLTFNFFHQNLSYQINLINCIKKYEEQVISIHVLIKTKSGIRLIHPFFFFQNEAKIKALFLLYFGKNQKIYTNLFVTSKNHNREFSNSPA